VRHPQQGSSESRQGGWLLLLRGDDAATERAEAKPTVFEVRQVYSDIAELASHASADSLIEAIAPQHLDAFGWFVAQTNRTRLAGERGHRLLELNRLRRYPPDARVPRDHAPHGSGRGPMRRNAACRSELL
jgi:hypothetical protein